MVTRKQAVPAPPARKTRREPTISDRLDRTSIALPLLEDIERAEQAERAELDGRHPGTRGAAPAAPLAPTLHEVIIDLNLNYPGGRDQARKQVHALVANIIKAKGRSWGLKTAGQGINVAKSKLSQQYVFGSFQARVIQELVGRDKIGSKIAPPSAIYRIWPDFPVKALLHKSICTVKADAAFNTFASTGEGIVWAVLDSGIDALHPHFAAFDNLNLGSQPPLSHLDFTGEGDNAHGALMDRYGHGTHVAGIIAGATTDQDGRIDADSRLRDERGKVKHTTTHPPRMAGMAPRCKLLSLKVLDDHGRGSASNLIAALEQIQRLNNHGRFIRVHGANLSVGYEFEPEWFACGQSPLCVEVDRLVKSGVVVVVAAGNTGYGSAQSAFKGTVPAGLGLTINDPGNAELAITVGATHRDMPHVYGVSYFSSKGPTGDGRAKPDLVAPGEKILSCDSAWRREPDLEDDELAQAEAREAPLVVALATSVARWQQPLAPAVAALAMPPPDGAEPAEPDEADAPAAPARPAEKPVARYREDSGTSMAAPHVSGVIAAFLSVRREFIGRPEQVKHVFVSTATDLKRDRYFQGSGLVDLMRAIQSV